MKYKSVSIIIPNWNLRKDCLELLTSIQKQTYQKNLIEVIVVDNNSTDGSVPAIKKNFPKTRVISLKRNLGYAGGVNVGIKKSCKRYILLLTNDVVLERNFLKYLVLSLSKNESAVAAGGLVFFYDKPNVIQKAYGELDENNLSLTNVGRGEIDHGQYKKSIEVGALTFTGILFKKEVFDQVGLFDERFFHTFEDIDFLLRIKKTKHKMIFVPMAKFWHKGSKSLGQESTQGTYYVTRNNLLIRDKYNLLTLQDRLNAIKFMCSSIIMSFFVVKNSGHYVAIARGIFDYFRKHYGKLQA